MVDRSLVVIVQFFEILNQVVDALRVEILFPLA
jgi:hypothetical protein